MSDSWRLTMKRILMVAVGVVASAGSGLAFHGDGPRQFRESLNGFNEAAAVVSTTGTGTFKAWINRDETEIRYELTFKDLEGDVRQAHIHIGWPQNSGGIVLWLCDSAANPSPTANTPECTETIPPICGPARCRARSLRRTCRTWRPAASRDRRPRPRRVRRSGRPGQSRPDICQHSLGEVPPGGNPQPDWRSAR